MDKNKAIFFMESSFLHDLLKDQDITDISYNGESIFYVSNEYGRKKSEIVIEHQEVKDFLRQMANICEKQFSFQSPNLDVTIGKYRLNAIHQSIGRINNEEKVTFSLRIASNTSKIKDNDSFMNKELSYLLKTLIDSRCSIVISGPTSSGKTELQKYLISLMKENTRVIVVDDVQELDLIRDKSDIDLTCWLSDDKNINATANVLIKNALRNNPDWLIVAEARGKEMNDVLNSAMTGVPIITTLHSFDIKSIPTRIKAMILMNENVGASNEIEKSINYHFHFYIYLNKKEQGDGTIKRYISDIAEVDDNGVFNIIYSNNLEKETYQKIRKDNLKRLIIKDQNQLEKFI